MFNDLRDKDNLRTYVTYVIMLCCIGVTVGCMIFTNLINVFSVSLDESGNLFNHFSFIFFHGFDDSSSIVHLFTNLYFLFVIGGTVEKVMGTMRFLFVTLSIILVYGMSVYLANVYGPAATGLIWAYAPILSFILMEGRRIKTRSAYEEHFSFLRVNLIIIATVLPIFTIFLQFYLSKDGISIFQALKEGLIPFGINLAIGFVMVFLFKGHIKQRLKSFNRRKKFTPDTLDNLAMWGTLVFPAYIAIVLYFYKFF